MEDSCKTDNVIELINQEETNHQCNKPSTLDTNMQLSDGLSMEQQYKDDADLKVMQIATATSNNDDQLQPKLGVLIEIGDDEDQPDSIMDGKKFKVVLLVTLQSWVH